VLVADGDNVSRTLIARMLERKGWSVRRVGDGGAALGMLEHERPDVIVLDLRLPGVDGLETVRRLRAREAEGSESTPIVVLVADADAAERMRLAELAVQALVPKPIDRQQLTRAVELAWSVRSARRQAA
jgi:two-component system, sensor histidine kinase